MNVMLITAIDDEWHDKARTEEEEKISNSINPPSEKGSKIDGEDETKSISQDEAQQIYCSLVNSTSP